MPIWLLIKKWFHARLFGLTSRNLLLLCFLYAAISWLLLKAAGEQQLTDDISVFVYFLLVTASTVGYGDFSPQSDLGKWVVILFVIPGGLSLFAALLGKMASMAVEYWRAGILGKRRVKMDNHILLLGWNGQRTMNLIRMLQHEETGKRPIILCSRSDIENPLPGEIEFVRVNSFTDDLEMQKTSYTSASCIVVDHLEDDITLSSALYCSNKNPTAHLLAYFNDESLSQLLSQHCPNVECIPAVGAEMLAKAAVDPGSSVLHQELLASTQGMTQYSTEFPKFLEGSSVEPIFNYMKIQHQATLIAIDCGEGIKLNPSLSTQVDSGATLFYIADERIDDFKWQQMGR